MNDVVIVKTECANLASVIAAFERIGARVSIADTDQQIAKASHLVLPGVGTFAAAMEFWRNRGLSEPILEHIAKDKPVLAICLGLQLLCEASEESPGVAGLGVVKETAVRFARDLPVPQMGWNYVSAQADSKWLQSGYYYFANSFYVGEAPAGARWASSSYGDTYVAAFELGQVLACQFHPELSGSLGATLMKNWLEACLVRGAPC